MNDYEVSTDPARIDVEAAHAFLSTSYWAKDMPLQLLRKAIENSLCAALHAARAPDAGDGAP